MSLRFHEIAESGKRIINPFDEDKLNLVGSVCGLEESTRILDLACGKGEMLVQWAYHHGIKGVGVDISSVFIEEAKERAYQMDVGDKVHFVVSNASDYPEPHHAFDVVSCIGATWIGGGLVGTIDLMRQALPPEGGLLVIGEPFWNAPPTTEGLSAMQIESNTFVSLGDTLKRFEDSGAKLIEMVLANQDNWDRYEATQWASVHQFLQENPDDVDADALRRWINHNRHAYLNYGRHFMGWGVFVLHIPGKAASRPVTKRENPNRPVAISVDDDHVWVTLADGRVIGNPLGWYEWLKNATSDAQSDVAYDSDRVIWLSLDHSISVQTMLRGSG